jgi:cold shock CspA family protein
MREIGFIKWFGGHKPTGEFDEEHMEIFKEIKYGFIKPVKGKELFVHKNDIISDISIFYEDLLVTFEIFYDEKKEKYKAIKVKKINDEEDIDLVKSLAFHNGSGFWTQALPAYLDRIDFESATEILFNRLKEESYESIKKEFITNLSDKFLTKFDELRSLLPKRKRFYVCLNMMKALKIDELKKEELIGEALDSLSDEMTLRDIYLREIPKEYLIKKKNLREKLNENEYFSICLEILQEKMKSNDDYSEILDEIGRICSKDGNRYYWDKLPEVIFISHPELRQNLSTKRRFEICKNIIDQQSSIGSVDKNIVKEVIECIKDFSWSKEEYWEQLPKESYENESDFRAQLPISMFMNVLLPKYQLASDLDREKYLDEIREKLLATICGDEYFFQIENAINQLPHELLFHEKIFEILPEKIQIQKLLETFEKNKDEAIRKIRAIIEKSEQYKREELLKVIPKEIYLEENNLLNLLSPINKVEILHLIEPSIIDIWPELNQKEKIYLIYRCLKENVDVVFIIRTEKTEQPLVTFLLTLLNSLIDQNNKSATFNLFHSEFQNFIIEKAWKLDEAIDLEPLLPNCKPSLVNYCEARAWPTEEDRREGQGRISRVFCPRGKRECSFNDQYSYGSSSMFGLDHLSGARILPNTNLSWKEWSLIEILKITEINPMLTDLSNSIEYVPRLSGWVNRLNEIRDRLRCSICEMPLVANRMYAKNLARYNSTVASCPAGRPHDDNTYFNHCWACREIIDSRESRIQVENYYICIHCGSGPQQSSRYRQGSICPKCSDKNIHVINDRDRKCNDCNHSFRLPAKQYLTGTSY